MECKKCGGKEHNKNEFVKGHQRYKCKNYRYQFVPTLQKGFNEQTKLIAYLLYISGLSLRTIVRLLHISATSVVALFTFKKNKLWIWKAYCTDTGQLIDWECGNRDTNTLKRLLQRLKKWNIKIYITDNWKSYSEMIPREMLLQSKKCTYPIERNNFRQRHWFARFRRKTCVVSRSLQMVDLTMALFAKFHCNSSFSFSSLFT